MNCAICGIRKPKRYCPGVSGDICSICCGTEREQSVDCPIGCEYLKEAHRHEKPPVVDRTALPNLDIRVPDSFLEQHEWLVVYTGSAIVDAALSAPGTTDYDIREALESLISTYRGLGSGLIIETRPDNLFAAKIRAGFEARIVDIRQRIATAGAKGELDDSTVLAVLVFLQRLEYANNNGRRRSRAFFDFLMQFHVPAPDAETLEPETPRLIL